MTPSQLPSERLQGGARVLTELAGLVGALETRLRDAEQRELEADERAHQLEDELGEIESAEPVLEMLEDVRRGVRSIDELYDAFLRVHA